MIKSMKIRVYKGRNGWNKVDGYDSSDYGDCENKFNEYICSYSRINLNSEQVYRVDWKINNKLYKRVVITNLFYNFLNM